MTDFKLGEQQAPETRPQVREAPPSVPASRSGLEPELGGSLCASPERTGLEPELGGVVRQKGVYVDEPTCIGCKHCAHVARNTFYIEPGYGRSRVFRQEGDPFEVVQEAIDTCPVDCIHWVDYTQLQQLEEDRKYQQVNILGSQVPATYTKRTAANRRKKPRPLSSEAPKLEPRS
jgi:ferredoxin